MTRCWFFRLISNGSLLNETVAMSRSKIGVRPRDEALPPDAGSASVTSGTLLRSSGWDRYWSIRRITIRSEEHTSELQSHHDLVCRLLLEKKKKKELEL